MINFERYVNYICDNKITGQQLTFLFAIKALKDCKNNEEAKQVLVLIRKYKGYVQIPDDKFVTERDKTSLIERGFIKRITECKSEDDTLNNFMLTEKFMNQFINVHEAGNDIWELYPPFLNSEKGNLPTKGIDIMEFKNLYAERINNDIEEHLLVVKDLKFAIKENLIKMKIEKWVRSEAWRDIRKARIKKANKTHTIRHGQQDL